MANRDIMKERLNFKPFEYPELIKFKDAIRHSYWIHTEFTDYISKDVHQYKVNSSLQEREVLRRCLLGISQVEVSVKTFWADLFKAYPKPEIAATGMTFAESEVRHEDAYSFLLEKLGLNSDFERIGEIPALIDRVKYLKKHLEGAKSRDPKKFALTVLLFSVFIEHVSLFGVFLPLMSFKRYNRTFECVANIVEATSKEEEIHGKFGLTLVNILKDEHPEWFDQEMYDNIRKACIKAEKAEQKVLDWVFEEGDLTFLTKEEVQFFMKKRFNNSLKSLGMDPEFEENPEVNMKFKWFEEKLLSAPNADFFNGRLTSYNKKSKTFNGGELF